MCRAAQSRPRAGGSRSAPSPSSGACQGLLLGFFFLPFSKHLPGPWECCSCALGMGRRLLPCCLWLHAGSPRHTWPRGQPGTVGALPGAPPASPRAGPSWLGWGCHGLGQAAGQSLGAVPATSPGIWDRGGSRSPSFVPGSVSPLDGAGRRAPSGAVGRDRRPHRAGGSGGHEAAQPPGTGDGAGSCSRAGKCGGHSVTKQTCQNQAVV